MSSPSNMPRRIRHIRSDAAAGDVFDKYAGLRALADETAFVFDLFAKNHDTEVALALTDMTLARKDNPE